jgi:2-succinyl-5-enolpyruvyl-6-hydroxy-3-cyclohexene-1-carboxylate synthase
MADPTRAFALVVADELARQGVEHVVVSPGARSTPLVLALAGQPGIDLHVRIDERSASFLALGIAKATRRPVPVLCTSGTAAAHFHAAVLEADQAAVPLIVLTADRPPELRGNGASQTIDQIGLYGSAVRWAVDLPVPELRPGSSPYWRSVVSRAVAVASGHTGAARGPVHLNIPLREPLAPSPDDGTASLPELAGRPVEGRSAPGLQQLAESGTLWTRAVTGEPTVPDELSALLTGSALRGVVVCGDGLDADDVRAIGRFSTRARWPVIAEPHSGARRGPTALRATDALLADAAFTQAHRPQLVIVCGRVGLSRAMLRWLGEVPHVVFADQAWTDVTRTARTLYACRPAVLAAVSVPATTAEWLTGWQRGSERAAAAVDAVLDETESLSEPRVARDLAGLLPVDGVLVVASSMPIRDLDLTMRASEITVMSNRGVSGIDGFVSTVQGVALSGRYSGLVVGLTGDLSLLHDVNGLIPGPDRRPDVTYVVVNNDGGGIFSVVPQGMEPAGADFDRLFATPHRIDLARIAAAYDVEHSLISSAAELEAALTLRRPGVRLLEVRSERAANAEVHRRLREAAAAAVASG